MPKQKDLKRLARARMKKTGESYTTARARILKKAPKKASNAASNAGASAHSKASAPSRSPVPELDYARVAGMSDEAVRAKTGRTWKEWVRALDAIGAASMRHRDIARHMNEELNWDEWWAQSVTVGYERIKGLRDVGQRRGGLYEANKSKTFPVPVFVLYKTFRDVRTRSRWLPGKTLTVRSASPNKTIRAVWEDGTSVNFYFNPKGKEKSAVSIQHGKLPSKKAMEEKKRFWGERLAEVGEVLKAGR
jgi:hypothetical protein